MIAKETVLMVGIGQGLYVFVINHIWEVAVLIHILYYHNKTKYIFQ